MSLKNVKIKKGNVLFVTLPNGDSVDIHTFHMGGVYVRISRSNGDWTNYPNVNYDEKVQISNVARRTMTLPKKKKQPDCHTSHGAVKVNEKTLLLTGLTDNETTVTVETYNTQPN